MTLLNYLKKILTSAKGKWVDEPTRETPYALAFGAKALIPMESELDVFRTGNIVELTLLLDELEENRDKAAIRMVGYHHQATRQGDKLVRPRAFKRGNLVLRRTFNEGKLKLNQGGHFIVVDDISKGAYRL